VSPARYRFCYDKISDDLESYKSKLTALPDIKLIKRDARRIQLGLMDYFGSKDWLNDMTIKDKKKFLHWLFDGKDEDGQPCGIFITKKARDVFDYKIQCKFFTGARFLKGDNIDYMDDSLLNGLHTNLVQAFKDEPKVKRRKLKRTLLWSGGDGDM